MLILHSGDKCTSVTGKSDFVQSSQLYRKIQLFDDHGMPVHPAQEIQAIEHCYNDLYLDASLPDPDHTPLSSLPFDCQEVIDELRALPRMKALFCEILLRVACVKRHRTTTRGLKPRRS